LSEILNKEQIDPGQSYYYLKLDTLYMHN